MIDHELEPYGCVGFTSYYIMIIEISNAAIMQERETCMYQGIARTIRRLQD